MIAIRKLHLQYTCFQRLAIDFTGIKVLTADLGLKQMTKHLASKIYYVFIQFREGKDVLLTRNQFGFDATEWLSPDLPTRKDDCLQFRVDPR